MKKIVSFGELLLRLASPGYTKLFQKDSLDVTFCGGEANVAVSLANYGMNSVFITKLPNNDIGRAAKRSLEYFGVDTSQIIYGDGRMGLYYLEKGVSQRPSKVIYDRAGSAFSTIDSSSIEWEHIFENVDWFHWTGITPALSDELVNICLEACKIAKKRGIPISCDLNYRRKLWDAEKAKYVMSSLMPYVDVCIGNEEDADMVLGIKPDGVDIENGIISREAYYNIAQKINKRFGCDIVAFTLRNSFSASINGWSGILYSAQKNSVYYSKEYDIHIVDRVGGGDSFTGALIYSLLSKYDFQDVIDFAVAASCLKQTIEGDFNRATIEDIKKLVNSNGNGRVER